MRVPKIITKAIRRYYSDNANPEKICHKYVVKAEVYQVLPNGACLYKVTEILNESGRPDAEWAATTEVGCEGGFNSKYLEGLMAAGEILKVHDWQDLEPKPFEPVKRKRAKKVN